MRTKRLKLEQFEPRQLFASDLNVSTTSSSSLADITDPIVADYVAANPGLDDYFVKLNFDNELWGNFNGFDSLRPVQLGDSIIAIEDKQLRLFAPNASSQYSQRSLLSTSDRIAGVITLDDNLLIATSRSNGLQTKFVTNLILAKVDENQQLQVVDSVVRDTKFVQLAKNSSGVSVIWGMPFLYSTSEQQAELDKAEFKLVGDSSSYEFSMVDYITNGSSTLPRQPLLSAQGPAGVLWADADRVVAKTYDGWRLIDRATGTDVLLNTGKIDWLTSVRSSGENLIIEGGMGEREFAPLMQYKAYGTVELDPSLNVVSTSVDLVGEPARLKFEFETYGAMFRTERSPDVSVYAGPQTLRVVTEVGPDEFREQVVQMPGRRLGMAGAFVINSDTILSVRAHIDDELIVPDAIPDLVLYVLKRNAVGDFEQSEQIPLGKFDFRASAYVQPDGTVTIQNKTQTLIIRTENDQVSLQTVDASYYPTNTIAVYRLTAFADVAFYSGIEHTTLVTPESTAASLPLESYVPPTYEEDLTDVSTLITLLQDTDSASAGTNSELATSSTGGESAVAEPLDINADQVVTPLDALLIINMLNSSPSSAVIQGNERYDVNGDGFLTPLDALTVINTLNANQTPLAESEEQIRRRRT